MRRGAAAPRLNCYPDSVVSSPDGSPFSAIDLADAFDGGQLSSVGPIPARFTVDQRQFVQDNKDDILVVPSYVTSVNHRIAQYRSITGNDVWQGRTIQEAAALQYGARFPVPNVNMGTGGFAQRGIDESLPEYCYAETVATPRSWPLSLDGAKGIEGLPDASLIRRARALRNDKLDPESVFYKTFKDSGRLRRWLNARDQVQPSIESAQLINRVLMNETVPGVTLDDVETVRTLKRPENFGDYEVDNLDAQAALAFLLLKNRVSNVVTIGNGFAGELQGATLFNPPIGFDFSHTAHRGTQLFLWSRIYAVLGKLIRLLKGEGLWKRTLIYIATDFGRDKVRPPGDQTRDFGTGHHLNNAAVLISPMLRGNRVLGGIDPTTAETYGLDASGSPDPTVQPPDEQSVYALLTQVLKIEGTEGLPAVPDILST